MLKYYAPTESMHKLVNVHIGLGLNLRFGAKRCSGFRIWT